MENNVKHLQPDGLFQSPAFSQVITTQGNGKTIYIGGQNAVDDQGELVGKGDFSQQTEQVMRNLQQALRAAGADFRHVVKLGIYMVQGQDALGGFQVSQKFFGSFPPPTITVLFVAGLVHPDYLLEMDAIAFVPS